MSGLEKMRKLCAKLGDDISERPHFGDVMFYAGKKPFASCGKEGVVVQLEPEHAATLISNDGRFTAYPRAKHTVQFDPVAVPQTLWEPLVRESLALISAKAKKPSKRR